VILFVGQGYVKSRYCFVRTSDFVCWSRMCEESVLFCCFVFLFVFVCKVISYRCTVHFEIYAVHSPTNALFTNLVKSFKSSLKYTIISLLRVSMFNDHYQGA